MLAQQVVLGLQLVEQRLVLQVARHLLLRHRLVRRPLLPHQGMTYQCKVAWTVWSAHNNTRHQELCTRTFCLRICLAPHA